MHNLIIMNGKNQLPGFIFSQKNTNGIIFACPATGG